MKRVSNHSRAFVRGFFCISIILLALSLLPIMNTKSAINSHDFEVSFSLTPYDPISITSDIDFEVFPGSGTVEDPYVIEGYNITTTGWGVSITGTTKYFIVRNCYVDANSGIHIDDVADGTATVINNMCNNNNDIGIWLRDSNSSTVINNTCNNGEWGIWLESSGSSTVANNTCNNNMFGIWLYSSNSSNVINNTCNNNNIHGIWLYNSDHSTVTNNTFTNSGLNIHGYTLDGYLSYTVENNWVNGKKIGFYTNLDSTTIAEPVYGQLILVNCTNVTVRDQIFNNATIGLFLYSCTSSIIINNTCNNNSEGILLQSSVSSTVTNNTCSNNFYGIRLSYSGNSAVANNTCNNNVLGGILLSYSESSTVANNTCNNNSEGIFLSSSGNSTVINNTCNNNNNDGISLWYSGSSNVINNTCNNNKEGIFLGFSGSSNVINNTCSNNNYHGIVLSSSAFCVVTYNHLQENERYGVYLGSDSGNNSIHHNTFVDNNPAGISQAYDECIDNFWYDDATNEGNYWSDWSGTSSYAIDGSENSIDLYPLDEPAEYSTVKTQVFFTFTLLLVVVPLLLTKLFSRKERKID